MAFTILTTVSDYEEKERPAISGKDRGWQHEKTKQAYLAKYPWILFRGSFVAGSSHLTNLPTTAPFPTRRSTLRCPTECAASACGARCIGRRTTMPFPPRCLSAKKPPYRTLMPTVFPNTCLHAELLRRIPLECADCTKRDRRRGAESDFPRKFAEKLGLMLARSEYLMYLCTRNRKGSGNAPRYA